MKKLKIEVIDGVPKVVEIMNLSIYETGAFLGYAVGAAYSEMKQRDPELAEGFKYIIGTTFLDGSPVWGVDVSGVDRISIFKAGKRRPDDAEKTECD